MDAAVRAGNALLMIALPLALGVVLARRWGLSWGLFGVGAVTFLASQSLHLPFNAWVLGPWMESLGLADARAGAPLVLMALLYGLSAGAFEEGARAIAYRLWLRRERSWREALMFGAGHGGLEAILLGGLALYALLQALTLRGLDLTEVVPPEQVELTRAQLETYWGLPWHAAILGAVERAFALCLHLGLTVLVLNAVRRRNALWWLGAVAWHALVNASAVVAVVHWGPYWAEGLLAVLAGASLGIVFALRGGLGPAAAVTAEVSAPWRESGGPPPERRQDRLDGTRFTE